MTSALDAALGALLYNLAVVRVLRFLLLVVLPLAAAFAQSPAKPKLSYKLLSVRVKGLSQFQEAQVIAVSGLKIGQFAGEEEFKRAVQNVGETGLFTNVVYAYKYSPAGCNLELQLTENDQLVPILFDNFVWFSDDDLLSSLRTRVPLFSGRLPLAGNLPDTVSAALEALLGEKKISGKVDYLRAGRQDGPIETYVYQVSLHPVVIRSMDFPGAASDELPALQAAAKPLMGQAYFRIRMRPQEQLNFLPVYFSRGYLKAQFADAQAKVVEDGAQTFVDVSFPVIPGRQYKLQAINWSGTAAVPSGDLQSLVHLAPGAPADSVQLEKDIGEIRKLYGTKGYLFARVDATPALDDATSTVIYQLHVTEGDLYRMAELQMDGLPEDAARKVAAQWQLKKGDPYDNTYVTKFFKISYRDVGSHGSYTVVPKQNINQQDKTVSVMLHFMPKG